MNPNFSKNIPQKEKSYDDIFKEMLGTFSSSHIIAFLNSTFKHHMSLKSIIEPLRTESNIGTRKIADYILKVTEPNDTVRYFHIEAQTSEDKTMAFRMVEYGIRFALDRARQDIEKDSILIEFPHAVVFYLRDRGRTPKVLNVTIKVPDKQALCYTIPTERMSDYTPEELLEQDKLPLFPFYLANFKGKDPEKFEHEWLEGCAKLDELVRSGRINQIDAEKLLENGSIILKKVKHPNEEEVLRKMETMFEIVGVGTDWIKIKQQQDEAVAKAVKQAVKQVEEQKAIKFAFNLLQRGLPIEEISEMAELPIETVEQIKSGKIAP